MPPMPPLPRKRVTKAIPFSYTGVDYFGPLFTKSKPGPQKNVGVSIYLLSDVSGTLGTTRRYVY